MNVEIDQSGKIGQTNVDTVLAFSNGRSFTILIPRKVKQECLRTLRQRGLEPHTIYLRLFVVGLYFLLKDSVSNIDQVLIDMEYPGKETQIKEHLYNLLMRAGVNMRRRQVVFGFIGKVSNAHVLAIAVFRGKQRADRVLTAAEIVAQF